MTFLKICSKRTVFNVILEYGSLAAWKLSEMSHRDISWKNARRGLSEDEVGHVLLSIEDIKIDAAKSTKTPIRYILTGVQEKVSG